MMARKMCLAPVAFAALMFSFPSGTSALERRKPNVVILFADNLGYSDISVFGAPTVQTPNIDRLAREGMKLNNWNSAAHLCSASRAALLTGKYPVRTGIYPGVFHIDAVHGMLPNETTIAELLKDESIMGGGGIYTTSIVGKWHLGHRPEFLPTNQGFDEWLGIPYHMSGGSVDHHICNFDTDDKIWLPLYENKTIVQQPVDLSTLAKAYADRAEAFIRRNVENQKPFFLYMPFSHVHQLCAPKDHPEQLTCQWSAGGKPTEADFVDAVEEMDWIAGRVLQALDQTSVANDTIVLFTSDNGPWLAEQSCSGSKGPFEGRWLRENVSLNCTACPHDYAPEPTAERPRRCVLGGDDNGKVEKDLDRGRLTLDGVHCGEDTGLGSLWEANLRMPALARWPGRIPAATETMALVSTLDIVPTLLSLVNGPSGESSTDILKERQRRTHQEALKLDGVDISDVLLGNEESFDSDNRALFFWRDGFQDGPLGPPFGRFDVAAVKLGRIKAWFWTKSAHYNDDVEVYHDPPLLFDTLSDPAEAFPLNPDDHRETIEKLSKLTHRHKASIDWTFPLALATDPQYIPCVEKSTGCKTKKWDDLLRSTVAGVDAASG